MIYLKCWTPHTHDADIWNDLLFISLARHRREGVYVPVLSVEDFYDSNLLTSIDKRVERVFDGVMHITVYWWDA